MGPLPGVKPWWASKGVIGGAVAIASGVAALALHADPTQQQAIQASLTNVADWVVQGVTIVASIVALYGRLTAKDRIAPTRLDTPAVTPKEN